MSYTPTEWQTGDVVTAEKLNKIEGAIEECSSNIPSVSGRVEVSVDAETNIVTINKSFNDLVAITQAGVVPFLIMSIGEEIGCGTLAALQHEEDKYVADFGVAPFLSSDPNDFMTFKIQQQSPGSGDDVNR